MDCDTTTMTLQLRSEDTEELLSDCEVAITVAWLKTSSAQGMLPPEEKAIAGDITLNMDKIAPVISKLTEDGVLDKTEVGYLGFAIPGWEIHPARIREWVENRDPRRVAGADAGCSPVRETGAGNTAPMLNARPV